MKKVLSVVLAAAMVLGMSVSAFAADYGFGTAEPQPISETENTKGHIKWANVFVLRDGKYVDAKAPGSDEIKLVEGDELYFSFWYGNHTLPKFAAPKNWKIKLSNDTYVDGAEFVQVKKAGDVGGCEVDQLLVKVTLKEDFDHYEEEDANIYFYLYDTKNKTKSDRVRLSYDFAGYNSETLTEDDLDWVLTVNKATKYTYAKGEKSAKATVDFNGNAFGEFKMYSDEKYTLDSSVKYNKDLSKEYDTDVEVINFRLGNVENIDLVFPSSKDNKQVVAVDGDELIPVESEYVKNHKFASGKKTNGYLVENAEYTQYALIDADVEVKVEAEEPAETTPAETAKPNPGTGANDFVGAAVALAVVSVAAAGALAFKK